LPKIRFIDIVFILFAVLTVFHYNYRPACNWDMLPYMAIVLERSEPDINKVHQQVYSLVKEAEQKGEIASGTFGELTGRTHYKAACYADAEQFGNELTYYRAKPLYTTLVWLLYLAGVPLILSTLIPSLIAGLGTLIILYVWMANYSSRYIAIVPVAFIAMLNIFTSLQNSSSPDMLSTFFLLVSFYLLDTNKSKWLIACMLALAVLTRIDNFIPAGVAGYILLSAGRKNVWKAAGIALLISVVAVLLIPLMTGNTLTWFTKFKFLESHVQYYFHVRNVFREIAANSSYWFWMAIGLFLLILRRKENMTLMTIVTASVVIRLVLFPSLQERFFAVYEFTLIVILLKTAAIYYNKNFKPLQAT